MQRFGEKLRALRIRHNLTLRELAAIFGYVSHSYINLVEMGRKKPTIDLVMKTAQHFHITPDQLLRDELEIDGDSDNPTATDQIA